MKSLIFPLTLVLLLGVVLPLHAREGSPDSLQLALDSLQARLDSLQRGPLLQVEEQNEEIKLKLQGNRLTVENLPGDELLEVYNIMGVKVYNRRIRAGITEVALPLARGYYIIKIGKFTRKIAIK